jgi:hypothetical protein
MRVSVSILVALRANIVNTEAEERLAIEEGNDVDNISWKTKVLFARLPHVLNVFATIIHPEPSSGAESSAGDAIATRTLHHQRPVTRRSGSIVDKSTVSNAVLWKKFRDSKDIRERENVGEWSLFQE